MSKLGIYVHVPYCVRKCNYCDFVSFPVGRDGTPAPCAFMDMQSYFEKLEQETVLLSKCFMEWDKPTQSGNWEVDSVFFGGGTPSLADPELICRQMDDINCLFNVLPDAEISLESNPGTLTEEKLQAYRWANFNRISIGVQSLNDNVLKVMGRIHDAAEAEASYRLARRFFDNINVDLMIGVPGQTAEIWLDTLKRVLDWEPEHLSFYSLQLEEGTPFYRDYRAGRLELPSWEENLEMYHRGLELIKAAGYHHYEVSNAAKPGFECRHNLKYWTMEPYLGLGKAAHSFMEGKRFEAWELLYPEATDAALSKALQSSGSVYEAFRSPSEPRTALFRSIMDKIPAEPQNELKGDFIFTQLRLTRGLDCGLYKKLFGTEFAEEYEKPLAELMADGMLAAKGPYICFTPAGLDQTNPVMEKLLNA